MHQLILDFAKKHKGRITGRVLDVGSFDVNGALRSVLPVTIGVDMREGPGVDQVCDVTQLIETFGAEAFDAVCSADALEHMEHWDASLVNMWGLLKPGGAFLITMANPKKGVHGYPHDYHRMEMEDFRRVFAGNEIHGEFFGGPSMGLICTKTTDSLDLRIRPFQVK